MVDDPQDAMLEAIYDEVEELRMRMPDADLARHLEQRADAHAPGTSGRAARLTHAGECWELADEPARARRCYERAAQDGGPAWIDPRAQLLGVLFELGEKSRAEALLDELRGDVRDGRARGPVHEFVGETLELNGRLDQALRWFQSGLTRDQGDDYGCLNGRYRVRRALGLPHDRYDAVWRSAGATPSPISSRNAESCPTYARAGYAAHLGFLGSTVAWPPGRNEPCWCASGLKYKKCCGALRFSAPDAD